MDVRAHNREQWDKQVARGNRWTVPVTAEQVAAARAGEWSLLLTGSKPVPREWFGELAGKDVLGLASGGGQQGPIMAAVGANVTVFDNSPAQLGRDREVAEREGLEIRTVEGDMRDLSAFDDESFDLIFHPCSNTFVPDVRPVWREAARVLRPGGVLLAGFCQPLLFMFDDQLAERGVLELRHTVPYSDLTSLTEAERKRYEDMGEPMCFGHRLEDQLAGQTEAGLAITGLYEDVLGEHVLDRWAPTMMATRSVKT